MILPLTIALLVCLIALWRRDLGIAAVVVALPTYLIRTTFAGIPTTALELSIYGLVIAWALHATFQRRWSVPKLTKVSWALLTTWILAWILATVFSTDQQASLGAVKAWLIDPLLFGMVVLTEIRSPAQRKMLLTSVAISGTIVAMAGLLQYVVFPDSIQDGRLSSFFAPVANYAAMFLVPLLIITTGALLWKLINRWWWTGALMMLVALALTVSFGGYLALAVGLAVLWWSWPNRRQRGLALMLAGLVFLGGIIAVSNTKYLAEKLNTTDRSSSLVRTQIWRSSVEMIKNYPIVGVGPNAYEAIYRQTIPRLYFPPLEWLVAQPHQLYLALWLETGLIGLIVFVVGVGWWLKSLWPRFRQRDPQVIFSVSATLAILVHGFVDTPLFKNDLMIVFVIVLVLPFLLQNEARIE